MTKIARRLLALLGAVALLHSGPAEAKRAAKPQPRPAAFNYGAPVDVGAYGASPTASPAQNVTAINAALAAKHFVQFTVPGVYQINDHLTIFPHTKLVCGPGVTIQQMSVVCIIRNAHMLASPPDSDITLQGGIWDGHYTGGSPGDQIAPTDLASPLMGVDGEIDAIGVKGFTVRDVLIQHCKSFGIQVSSCNDVTLNGIHLDIAKDGIHVNGPAARLHIAHVRGYTGDDFIALNAWDWVDSSPTAGDITDVDISDVTQLAQSPTVPGNTNEYGLIKFLAGTRHSTTANIQRVHVNGVRGVNSYRAFTFLVDYDPREHIPSGPGIVSDITFNDVAVRTVHSALFWLGQNIHDVSIHNIALDPASTGTQFFVNGGTTTQNLTIDGLTMQKGIDTPFDVRGTLDSLTLTHSALVGLPATAYPAGQLSGLMTEQGGGHIGHIFLGGDSLTGGVSLFFGKNNAASAPTEIGMSQCTVSGVDHVFLAQQPLTVQATGCHFFGITQDLAQVSSSFTGRFAAATANFAAGGVPLTLHGGTARIAASSIGFDLSQLSGMVAGDRVVNANAALPCGLGPCLYTGTIWKNVTTGAAYSHP